MKGERDVLRDMKGHYQTALERVYEKIDALSERDDLPGIRQRKYQEALAEQIGGIIDELDGGAHATLEGYLKDSYEDGFIGAMYSLQRQGVPLAFPIDQKSMARAATATADGVKLSKRVYSNTSKLQKQVMAEITRGFAQSSHVTEVAGRIASETDIAGEIKRNVKGRTDQAMRRAMTIARTEKGRVMSDSKLDAMRKAKEAGADVVKQWDSTLDGKTRKSHRKLDGQIRELDEPFEVNGHKGMAPHKFGRPEEDINCRCCVLQRARAALEMPDGDKHTKWDGISQSYVDLSDAENYQVFKTAYLIKIAEHDINLLGKRITGYNKQMAALEAKSYSGIWRDAVTVKDYAEKAGAIPAKRDYFGAHMADDPAKFGALNALLSEFEKDGKKHVKIEAKRKEAQAGLTAKKRELAKLRGEEFAEDPFSPERKEAAHSFKTAKAADKLLRATAGKTWKDATKEQREALYAYTQGSGKFNRPLAGFQKPWNDYGSGFEQKFHKGPGKVWIDYEGMGDAIRAMTDAIAKSTYGFDVWLNRGCDFNALESFLGISSLSSMSNGELQKFVGTTNTIHNFISTGVADGTGFTDKQVTMRIYAPGGTEMIYAEPFSNYGKGAQIDWDGKTEQSSFGSEAEMIVQRGASYTITKIEKKGGKIYIDMEIHPENGYDKFQQDGKWDGSKERFK